MLSTFDRILVLGATVVLVGSGCGAPDVTPPPGPSGGDAGVEPARDGGEPDAGAEPDRPFAPVWTPRSGPPPLDPAGRWAMRAVYSPDAERLLLFGGSRYPAARSVGDFWALDFADDTWTAMPVDRAPAPRYCYCSTYLPEQRQMLLVGGRGDRGALPEGAWTFDVTTGEWQVVNSAALPAGVVGCGAVWMPSAPGGGRAIVFGGGARRYDTVTWAYDPAARRFEAVATATTATTAPPGRQDGMMVYDPGDGGRVLLFGGATNVFPPEDAELLDDMWSFDGIEWRELDLSGPRPAPRRFAADAFDESRREWLLFGGTREVEDFNDLWMFDANVGTWVELSVAAPQGMPGARGFATLALDPNTGSYRLFGGLQQPDFRAPDDGWLLTLRP